MGDKEMTKKEAKRIKDREEVLEWIAKMPESHRGIGERLHELILDSVPELNPRLWYGMPGYAKEGPVLCFFRKDRYMQFGVTEKASFPIEEDAPDQLMAQSWFFTELDEATEARIADIVKKATR